ncbi:MAG: hypothetical protein M0P74_10590 [Syntrophales bacterium]|jgi:hypothetical protein|nr:hypothetical protein [Syntrophales bacterium]
MSNVKKVNINNCIGVRTLQLLFACLAIFWGGLPVYAAGVTIITHGWNPSSGAPVWLESMRDAIAEKHLAGEKSYGKITVTKQEGSLIAACAPWDFDAATGSTGEIIVVLDWSAVANHLLGGPSVQDIAAVVIDKIVSSQNGKRPLAELPIHLIGHSRGGGMGSELARLLGERGIVVDHLTTLDPHPLTNADIQPFFSPAVIDTPAAIYENVIFADNYMQTGEYPEGIPISGAINRVWKELAGGYYDNGAPFSGHRNVYLLYQGTIDAGNPVYNGEATMEQAERAKWFSTEEEAGDRAGFAFSRIKATNPRPADGLHRNALFRGAGSRIAVWGNHSLWPNIADVQLIHDGEILESGQRMVRRGDEITLRMVISDHDSGGEIRVYFDRDRNPYNGNDLAAAEAVISYTAGDNFQEKIALINTSRFTAGTGMFIRISIADGSFTRFFYAPAQLSISENFLDNAIIILRIMADLPVPVTADLPGDMDGDQKTSIAEALYLLQKTAGLRD